MDAKTFLCCIEAIKSSNIAVQEDAANQVAALAESCWLPQILHHLDDPNPLVRRVMLWTLRNYTEQISYPQLLAYLHDPDLAVREAALLLFMEGGSTACDALVAAVSSEDDELRFSAVQALGQFRTPEAIAPLIHAAGAKNLDIREVAVLSLGVYADARVIPQLLAALADEPQIRLAALEGLRGRELAPEDMVKVSGCLFDAEFPEIRAAAVAVLGPLVPEESADDASPRVRRAVASVAASPQLLARMCTDADASVRMAAAETVGKQRYMMEDVLLPLLSDAVPGVRRAAVTALASSRGLMWLQP
jgi:HEAT repeat protein